MLSELESAKPGSNATMLDSPATSSLCRSTCTAFAAWPGSEPKSRWAGDEWEEWDGLMMPPNPTKCWERPLAASHSPLLPGLSCQGGGGQDSSQAGFTKSQGQPLFHENTSYSQIHTILASLHQQGHREAKDGERCLDLLASFWASSKTKATATAGEQIQHTDAPQILQIFCI